ncbi:hypothetical protein AGLY_011140, partial [Aphis glycines]
MAVRSDGKDMLSLLMTVVGKRQTNQKMNFFQNLMDLDVYCLILSKCSSCFESNENPLPDSDTLLLNCSIFLLFSVSFVFEKSKSSILGGGGFGKYKIGFTDLFIELFPTVSVMVAKETLSSVRGGGGLGKTRTGLSGLLNLSSLKTQLLMASLVLPRTLVNNGLSIGLATLETKGFGIILGFLLIMYQRVSYQKIFDFQFSLHLVVVMSNELLLVSSIEYILNENVLCYTHFDNLLVLFHHQPQFYHTGVPHYYISLLQLDELHEMK